MSNDKTRQVESKKDKVLLMVEKIYDDAKLPTKPVEPSDSGFDVFSYSVKKIYYHGGGNGEGILDTDEKLERKFVEPGVFELQCNERALVGTGIRATLGEGYELQVRPRSGLALKKGLTVVNTPGTIDASFRGEIGIIILNTSRQTQTIKLGDSIAQIVPMKVVLPELVECKLDNTERGDGGFGHSDEKNNEPVNKNRPVFAPSIGE